MTKDAKLTRLQNLGLNQGEAQVYYALLSLKQAGTTEIAKRAGIKRPTCYLVLKKLMQHRLAAATTYRGVTDYRALPVEHLKAYVQRQNSALQEALPNLRQLYAARAPKQRLRIYNDITAMKVLLEKCLRESLPLYAIGGFQQLQEYLGDYWAYFAKRATQHGIPIRVKELGGQIILLLWSDKVAFVELGDIPKIFAFKNAALSRCYLEVWKNY